MTKVLIITNRFIFGGIEKLLLDVFEHSQNREIQYDLLTLTDERDQELMNRIQVRGINCYSLSLNKHNVIERQLYHYKALYRFVKKGGYNVVHINITSYARSLDMMTVKAAGIPIRIIHSHSAGERDPFFRKILKPMRRLYDISATEFLACSDDAARHLFSRRICANRKYVVINNGIDIHHYLFSEAERERIRKKLGIKEDELIIGHIGRLTEAKNHLFLLEVFRSIHQVCANSKLLLVGDGEKKEEIKSRIVQLGIQSSTILYGASSDTRALLSAMDVFVFPSTWEGLGISVIEAQCNGLPCFISEKVPRVAAITSNVFQLNIQDGAKVWAERILKQKLLRVDEIEKIKDAGYDINSSVLQLENIYLQKNETNMGSQKAGKQKCGV